MAKLEAADMSLCMSRKERLLAYLSTYKLFCRLFLCQWKTNSSTPLVCLPCCYVRDSVFRGKGMSGAVIHANTRHTTKQKLTRKCEFEGHLTL